MDAIGRALLPLPDAPIAAGFSGGLDSTMLLHALAASEEARQRGVRAIHVHHGLHAEADAWADHCDAMCAALGVPLQIVRVQVDRADGHGPEGAARAARLAAFRAQVADGEMLALAHHRDDQAETVLLRLLRGAGGDGLAAMRRRSRLGSLHLWRPLLDLPRDTLRAAAERQGLRWIEDGSNADALLDRNFLRLRVVPLLSERWPHAARSLARSATLLAEQSALLAALASADCDALQVAPDALSLPALLAHPKARRARILRSWVGRLDGSAPPASVIAAIERDLLPARADGDARVAWKDMTLVRWRNQLHALASLAPFPPEWTATWDGAEPLQLPDGAVLALHGASRFDESFLVRPRHGGERIRLPGRDHTHALKHVLQEHGVAPWLRARMPLLLAGDGELLAAGDAIVSARLDAWMRARDARLQWTPSIPATSD